MVAWQTTTHLTGLLLPKKSINQLKAEVEKKDQSHSSISLFTVKSSTDFTGDWSVHATLGFHDSTKETVSLNVHFFLSQLKAISGWLSQPNYSEHTELQGE